jgi:hypothetical protein
MKERVRSLIIQAALLSRFSVIQGTPISVITGSNLPVDEERRLNDAIKKINVLFGKKSFNLKEFLAAISSIFEVDIKTLKSKEHISLISHSPEQQKRHAIVKTVIHRIHASIKPLGLVSKTVHGYIGKIERYCQLQTEVSSRFKATDAIANLLSQLSPREIGKNLTESQKKGSESDYARKILAVLKEVEKTLKGYSSFMVRPAPFASSSLFTAQTFFETRHYVCFHTQRLHSTLAQVYSRNRQPWEDENQEFTDLLTSIEAKVKKTAEAATNLPKPTPPAKLQALLEGIRKETRAKLTKYSHPKKRNRAKGKIEFAQFLLESLARPGYQKSQARGLYLLLSTVRDNLNQFLLADSLLNIRRGGELEKIFKQLDSTLPQPPSAQGGGAEKPPS